MSMHGSNAAFLDNLVSLGVVELDVQCSLLLHRNAVNIDVDEGTLTRGTHRVFRRRRICF